MTRHFWTLSSCAWLVTVIASLAGLAASSQTPRPFPTPGGTTASAPATPSPTSPAAPAAGGPPPSTPPTPSTSGAPVTAAVATPTQAPAVTPVAADRRPRGRHEAGPPEIDAPAAVRVGIAGPDGYTVRAVELEEYVAGVLTGEAARNSDPAVLQALAVAIRTYALKNLNRHRAEGFDVCDETHCQVLRRPTTASTAAAQATAGRVLTWRGALAIVYYSASCGGHTQIPSAVWPGAEDPPYLPARRDDGCGGDPAWNATVNRTDLERTLRTNGFRGTLKRVRVLDRDRSGRVRRLRLDGMQPSTIPGTNLRMAVGPTLIKSMTFELQQDRDAYLFTGHGYGHGVGMCVIGATRLAARGETAEALLARYYPGTTLGVVNTGDSGDHRDSGDVLPDRPPAGRPAPTPPRPALTTAAPGSVASPTAVPAPGAPVANPIPTGNTSAASGGDIVDATAAARREVEALAASARNQLAQALGVPAPGAPTPIVLHPSDESYERTTARHWFTFGAFTRGGLHLMPIDQLRQRGLLERVVRRELVHALADEALINRPQWVRDGAALYFADPTPVDGDSGRAACPADADLLQPVSAGALAQAYAQARACFARQIRGGRAWRDVR